MTEIPADHPRHESLVTRHRIEAGVEAGITSKQGLVAQGRGEAYDYLLGEQTISSADEAERVAAAHLLLADHPVLSVNGNVAALVPGEMVELAESTGAALEVNLFNRTAERMDAIADYLREHGAEDVKGWRPTPASPASNTSARRSTPTASTRLTSCSSPGGRRPRGGARGDGEDRTRNRPEPALPVGTERRGPHRGQRGSRGAEHHATRPRIAWGNRGRS